MWAVVDVETTGVYWKSVDRIIEIAIVRLDTSGSIVDEWETLLNPDRDLGPTCIHGITGRDVLGAPRFAEVADEVLWRLAGHVPVGHNVRFDLAFLTNEFGRLGLDFSRVQGVCTMSMAGRFGAGRSLLDCCAAFGVPLRDHHTALADAEATGLMFAQMLSRGGCGHPPPLPSWPRPAAPAKIRSRRDPPAPRSRGGLMSLAHSVGVPADSDLEYAAAVSYLDLLDRVLEDRNLSADEVAAMSDLASDWGISMIEADKLHRAYVAETWRLAEADGVVTRAELRDIEILAELLGVSPRKDDSVGGLVRGQRSVVGDWEGKSVCFTGETQCCVNGRALNRADLEAYAEDAGMVIKGGVSRRLDLLVVADPDSLSGKARKATELGVRKMYDVAFLRSLGVECQAGSGA